MKSFTSRSPSSQGDDDNTRCFLKIIPLNLLNYLFCHSTNHPNLVGKARLLGLDNVSLSYYFVFLRMEQNIKMILDLVP